MAPTRSAGGQNFSRTADHKSGEDLSLRAGRNRHGIGQSRTELAEVGPTLSDVGPKLAEIEPDSVESAEFATELAEGRPAAAGK